MASERKKNAAGGSGDGFRLGIYGSRGQPGRAADWVALGLSLVWIAGVAVFFFVLRPSLDPDSLLLTGLAVLLAVFFPLAMIWMGASILRSARGMAEETSQLHASVNSMRAAYEAQRMLQQMPAAEIKAATEPKERLPAIPLRRSRLLRFAPPVEEREAEQPKGAFVSSNPAQAPAPEPIAQQGSLALDGPRQRNEPLAVSDFIGALNFPEDENDKTGFDQLRKALLSPHSAKLVRAAQDILTLLSKDGLYMDDLAHDRARPELWRAFAEGERGPKLRALGGIRNDEAIGLVASQMRQDPVYRDAAHHFLREFDHTFARFAKVASDAEISRLTETRSARAFMLISRATGTFD